MPKRKQVQKFTLARAREVLARMGVHISTTKDSHPREYRVRLEGQPLKEAYFTTDLEDALGSGRVMASEARRRSTLRPTVHGDITAARAEIAADLDKSADLNTHMLVRVYGVARVLLALRKILVAGGPDTHGERLAEVLERYDRIAEEVDKERYRAEKETK